MKTSKGVKIRTIIAVLLLWITMLPLASICMFISFEQVHATIMHTVDPLAAIACALLTAILIGGSILLTIKLLKDE